MLWWSKIAAIHKVGAVNLTSGAKLGNASRKAVGGSLIGWAAPVAVGQVQRSQGDQD